MNRKIYSLICFITVFFVVGCGLPTITISSGEQATAVPVEPTAAVKEPEVMIPITAATPEVESPPPTKEPSATPEPEMTPTIAHLTKPVEPVGKYQKIHDQTSDKYASQKRAYGGDEFVVGHYERSFLQDMTYLPYIDILTAELNREDDNWIFVRIQVMSDPLHNLEDNPLFGVELDVDINSRGEYLILAKPPAGKDWTTNGVQVWFDLDKNIGGANAVKPDEAGGDGYEDLIFDQGSGGDPDLAWIRISPEGQNYVETAFKRSLLGGEEDEKFIWLPWAVIGITNPALFEFNDHFTLAAAGSPLKEDAANYPLKELWGVDNTCRGSSGFAPQPSNTGTCPNYDPPPSRPDSTQPAQPPPPPPDPGPILIK